MGFSGFEFTTPHEVFREHARLSAQANDGRRAFDIGAWADITAQEYEAWQPAAWPMVKSRESARGPMFRDGKFMHADGKARFVPLTPRLPRNPITARHPLVLNTGRVRDHWHTMTRTGKSGRLSSHVDEPYVEVNTIDALRYAVRAGELARLHSGYGSMVVRARIGLDVPRGMVFAPIHWNRAYSSDARVGALTNPVVDPISGEPELKHTPVSIEPFAADWYGVMLTRKPSPPPDVSWWTKVQGEQFVRYELAGQGADDWATLARRLLGVNEADVDWMEYRDAGRKVYRAAYLVDDRLEGCVYFDSRPTLPERNWLSRLFTVNRFNPAMRSALMAGRAIEGADQGPTICSCFGVGRNPIAACARELGAKATTVEIGRRLKCGTNCGSCIPEIQRIIADTAVKTARA
jgi:assimilatory nitrate reductase catalytic subunit